MGRLITGGNGMLGTALKREFPNAEFLNGKGDLDLTDLDKVEEWFKGKHYSLIIHCAAFTNLTYCEDHLQEASMLHWHVVNVLNKYCDKLIYISTNPTTSQKVYYLTKRSGEFDTLKSPNNLVISTNIYGNGGLAKWCYDTLSDGGIINGYANSMFNAIHVEQLAKCINGCLLEVTGTVRIGGNYILSKYDFAKQLAIITGLDSDLINEFYLNTDESNVIDIETLDYKFSLFDGMEILKKELQNE